MFFVRLMFLRPRRIAEQVSVSTNSLWSKIMGVKAVVGVTLSSGSVSAGVSPDICIFLCYFVLQPLADSQPPSRLPCIDCAFCPLLNTPAADKIFAPSIDRVFSVNAASRARDVNKQLCEVKD